MLLYQRLGARQVQLLPWAAPLLVPTTYMSLADFNMYVRWLGHEHNNNSG